ncbi:MAG: GNAT family N-acetyltransferase [candidate division WOR-3 bacterium]
MTPYTVTSFRTGQLAAMSRMLARAFAEEQLWTMAFPDHARRLKQLARLFVFMLRYGLTYGKIDVTPELEGVAVWIAERHARQTPRHLARTGGLMLPFTVGLRPLLRLRMAHRKFDELQQRNAPTGCEYLLLIGVAPEARGRGLGASIVRHGLARLAARHRPGYLETQTEHNVRFFERLGFVIKERAAIPENDLPVWSMVWQP